MRRRPLLLLFAPLLLVAATAFAKERKDGVTLTLIHVNDGESILLDAGKGLEDYGGASRFVTLFERLRDEAGAHSDATVVVSAGDNYEPGPSLAAWRENGELADAIVLSSLDLDASAIGNHEFDFGPRLFADFMGRFPDDVPFLSANLDVSRSPELQPLRESGRLAPSTIVRAGKVDVGIVGATTQLLAAISSPGSVRVEDPVAPVQAAIDDLQRRGVQIIVLLSHMQGISEDVRLVSQLRCVDLVISGGGGEVLANVGTPLLPGDERVVAGGYPVWLRDAEGRHVPDVTTPGYYRYVGRLVARFDGAGELVEIDPSSGIVRVASERQPDGVRPDPRIEALAIQPLRDYIGPLAHSVVATVQVPLDGRRATLRSSETNEANLLTDAMMWSAARVAKERGLAAPAAALLNSGSIRHDSRLLRGQRLSGLDLLMATPFANELVLVDVAPRQLKDILENAVSKVEDADGRFLHVAGLKFQWRTGPVGQADRVRDVTLASGKVLVRDGQVVSTEPVTIVTTDFIQRGGDEHPFTGTRAVELGLTTSEALTSFIATELGGEIRAADYPPGGEGRIVRLR